MQKKRGGTPRERAMIYKPYLRGNWHSVYAAKRGWKILGYQVMLLFIYLFLGQILMLDILWLRWLINLGFLLAVGGLLYADGAKTGVDDLSFAEITLQRKESGREVSPQDLDRCYHPAKGFFTAAVGVLPVFLLAILFAIVTQPVSYRLGSLPTWVTAFERRADVGLALQYYHETIGLGLQEVLRIIIRLLIFPLVNLVGADNSRALLTLERLSPLLVLLVPSGYGLGYLQGRRLRASVHGAISSNARRREQRERRERKRRKKQENRLV